MKRIVLSTILATFLLGATAPPQRREVIRLGTLAPQGSMWDKILRQMGSDLRKATDGQVELRIYAGGVVGDESEMIRKMRIGQLQAAAISAAGLAEIDSRAYALMLPLMFQSYEEWDYVRQRVNPTLNEKLQEDGFIVLTWSDVGWVYFFTTEPMQRPDELRRMKLASSISEPATIDILKWAGFNPVPISNVDMLTGLQTGLINATYLPLLLAEASQFYRYTKNMTDMKWAPLQGALVMHEKGWERLTAEQRETLLGLAKEVGEDLRKDNRSQEERSLQAMKSRGLNIWPVDEAARAEWRKAVESAYPQIRQKLVPPELFDQVGKWRDEFRSTK